MVLIREGGNLLILALDKQVHIYSIDTSAFYNKKEEKVHNCLAKMYIFRKYLKNKLEKPDKLEEGMVDRLNSILSNTNRRIKKKNNKLRRLLDKNRKVRHLNPNHLNKRNIISVFESTLTRTLQIPTDTLGTDIIVVKTYFFKVLEDIILKGFMYNNEKYVCFTASAGQIRTKKTVFMKEKTLHKYQKTLMCGLSIKDINKQGGININKYLAYLALCNSATDEWNDFDIDKSIVVDDMETTVRGLVDYINHETYKITRKEMGVPINHTDGCGMILPSKQSKNTVTRLPWIKGLLVPFPWDKYIKEINKGNDEVVDIYGVKHHVLKEKIEVIFTRSQFKAWKYYQNELNPDGSISKSGWDKYKEYYKKYNCQAGKCREEEDTIENAKYNYQMLQTLIDMTDRELKEICKTTINDIMNVGYDRKTMLKILGVTPSNTNMNYYQQALNIYPELLNDRYSKHILKQVKKRMVKDARAAKIEINGKYTYICPDLYAFCEFLFSKNKNPKGLLKDGEVYCSLYKNEPTLVCLRPPHLMREYGIRNNVVDVDRSKWFITKGVYTSCHDLISKLLQFDVDGDVSLVVADKTIINVAKRNMKGIVPLYYEMANANVEKITNKSIYNGLRLAYSGGNIGMISNNITKVWNSDNINLDVIKFQCMETNFNIDFAKTLYKPERPNYIKKLITNYTKYKVPHFFIYAKGKKDHQVEEINNSVVNRLENIIPNPFINIKAVGLNNFNHRMLMSNGDIDIDDRYAEQIIDKYTKLDLRKRFMEVARSNEDETRGDTLFLYRDIRREILLINPDIKYVVDVLIKYLYKYKKSNFKTTLWSSFGDVIVENIKNNINIKLSEGYIQCENCKKLILPTNNKKKYCQQCAREIDREKARERMQNIRKCSK